MNSFQILFIKVAIINNVQESDSEGEGDEDNGLAAPLGDTSPTRGSGGTNDSGGEGGATLPTPRPGLGAPTPSHRRSVCVALKLHQTSDIDVMLYPVLFRSVLRINRLMQSKILLETCNISRKTI